MKPVMKKQLILGMLFAAISFCQAGWAKELSPIEKALQAIAEKDKQTASATSNTNTGSAQTMQNSTKKEDAAFGIFAGTTLTAMSHTSSDPMKLTATATAETIVVSWSNTASVQADFVGYYLSRVSVSGGSAQPVTVVATPLTSYRDVSATAKTIYQYQVAAYDSKGNTLLAAQPVYIKLAPSIPPAQVEEAEIASLDERIHLKWKKVKKTSHDILGYLIYRQIAGAEEKVLLNKKPVTKSEYYDDTGGYNQDYSYSIAALDSHGLTGTASASVHGRARNRNRNGLILTSTAYRGMGLKDVGLNADIQFSYFIGTLYGDQDDQLSEQALYLDPISLWLLTADAKYTMITERNFPVSIAAGGRGGIQLFAGQQSSASGSFTFSEKSELDYIWGGYTTISRSFGEFGIHGGYMYGTMGDPIFFLSKYMDVETSHNLFYVGFDFPIVRRMNAALEVLVPLNDQLQSKQHPILVNLHVDRLFNFDISYLNWDQGWAFLGYFNIRFTVFPGQ